MEVPMGRAGRRWILDRLSDGAGTCLPACKIFAVH
jgi:hypothetical protein